jgi:hypothetical protein
MEKNLVLNFANLSDLFSYIEQAKGNPQVKASERLKKNDFNAFKDWSECQAAALKGWPEGLARVKALSEAFVSKVGSGMLKESFAPAETGLFFDVGLVMTGQPEAWLQVVETEEECKGGKLVTIGLNCSVSAAVSASVIRQRGAAVMALVQLLEQAGRSVCVKVGIGVNGADDPSFSLCASVILKGFGEALDEDKLAFWLVCEDAFRRCLFRLMEATPIWKGLGAEVEGGYGKIKKDWNPPETDIVLGGMTAFSETDWTEEKAKTWIEEQLKAQGVSLAE